MWDQEPQKITKQSIKKALEKKQKDEEPLGARDWIPEGISHLGRIVSRVRSFSQMH